MATIVKTLSSREAVADVAVDMIASAVLDDVRNHGAATLMLSGGSTPKAAYAALSHIDLPWSNVSIGLVDDRWVDEDNAGSNAAMIRRTLLQNKGVAASFTPMKTPIKTGHDSHVDAQGRVELAYAALPRPYSLVLLGMGPDGHTASWFPDAQGLDAALDRGNVNLVQAVTAHKSDVTGEYLDRMTLTLSAIATTRRAVLLITGTDKHAVFDSALNDPHSNSPIRRAIEALGDRLIVLYAE